MNDEPPQSNGPERQRGPAPKWIWLLGALSPTALIMLATIYDNHHHGGSLGAIVWLELNPLITIISCYWLLNKPGQSKVITILGALFVGILFAVFNMFLGTFAGCAADSWGRR
jgi:hypothetical protein